MLRNWCENVTEFGPRALPVAEIGGHLCCDQDLCNIHLKPKLLTFKNGQIREYQPGVKFKTFL